MTPGGNWEKDPEGSTGDIDKFVVFASFFVDEQLVRQLQVEWR